MIIILFSLKGLPLENAYPVFVQICQKLCYFIHEYYACLRPDVSHFGEIREILVRQSEHAPLPFLLWIFQLTKCIEKQLKKMENRKLL